MTGPLVIVQPGRKLSSLADTPGDFADWVLAGMGREPDSARVVYPQDGDTLPDAAGVGAAVVTGSGAMVTDQTAWIQASEAWLRALVALGRPVLGICFGHQLLAHALGGEVADNPNGIEVGTVITRPSPDAADDPLFGSWPATVPVQASHQQSVIELPPGAIPLAASEQDPHHAFRYGDRAWGVQFHPEFDAAITAAYEAYYAPRLDPVYRERQAAARAETPQGDAILQAFAARLSD